MDLARRTFDSLAPLAALASFVMGTACACGPRVQVPAGHAPEAPAPRRAIDVEVDALLAKMTLQEKVGQMTEVTIEVVSKGRDGRQEPHELDPAKLERAIVTYHVGSILNVATSAYSLSHWHDVITAIEDVATKKTRLGIPVLYGIDAIHGATYTRGATLFPQSIALASTWDPELAKRVAEVTAREVRASGIPWNYSPVLDLGRQPLWPRFWETYGEDVTLARMFGTAYVLGSMGADVSAGVAPCLKHFVGYGAPESGKDRTPARIDERTMRETFLPTFEAAVRAGAPTVMVNSSEVSGVPGHANRHWLTDVLKGEWGFQGFVVSDWEDVERLYTRHHVARSPKDAVRMAVMAGVDMSMVPLDFSFYDLLLELVKEGAVPMSRIDDAVRRILRVKRLVGLFEHAYPDRSLAAGFASKESAALNLGAAREAITLLKNASHVLPLKKDARVLVTGPTANLLSALNGGWTITWQGDDESLYPKDKPTILGALRATGGEKNVAYVPGTTFDAPIDIPAAVAAARAADVVVACLGEKAYCETPGDIDDLTLEEAQLELVLEIAKTGKPVVVVLVEGRPRIIRRIADKVQAIVLAPLPGMEGGSAVGDILFGFAVPSGKLPFSYPKYPNALVTYDHRSSSKYDPEFPFGFGLSYASFAYEDLRIDKDVMTDNGRIEVRVSVENTGSVAGKEVVQLYVSDRIRSVSPPVRELKAFKKVALGPGEKKTVELSLDASDLSFIDIGNKRVVEKGTFDVAVGPLKQSFELR